MRFYAAIPFGGNSVTNDIKSGLASDISEKGIVMTGGGSLVGGLDKLIEKRTGVTTIIADDAVSCVARGTGKALENLDKLSESLLTDDIRKDYRQQN